MNSPLSAEELHVLDAYWRAANYLTVGQIYLQDNPLLREPLRAEHVKPRLLGHWGTSPGLSLVYAHVNRLIRAHDASAIFLAGPGHGGPAVVANVYLEGTWSEVYPDVTPDAAGMRALFRQFSTPGGIPSHVSPPTPGSIHEGGELGYVLTHAFGAAFDNPDLLVVAVVGDGEAETAPLEGSWKGISFLNPARDGAVLPVLHLNGYKIAGPTVLGRATDEAIRSLLGGHGYEVHFVDGDDPARVHQALAATLEACYAQVRGLQAEARARGVRAMPRWPAIVLRTPKGWTGPKVVDGVPVEGTFRAHQVPLAQIRTNPQHLALLEAWMRSYRPEELFDAAGRLRPELAALAPRGARRMSANPHANGGALKRPLDLPDFAAYAVDVATPGTVQRESTRQLGLMLRDVFTRNAAQRTFRLFCPDETNSNRLGAVFEVENRCFMPPAREGDERVAPDGRVMEVLSEHNCQGWLEGYVLTGRHGLFATYEAFALIVASMATQHAKWLEACAQIPWRAPVPSLNYLLTSTCWRNDHNGFSHQGPGFMDTVLSKKGTVARIYLPPDANCLLSVADHALRSRGYVNLIIIDKQPQLQWLGLDAAREHCARGASVWAWAGTEAPADEPDVVLACAGDTATLETLAAAHWLRRHAPGLRVRVVNVVDLMTLYAPEEHPHGMPDARFVELFTREADVVFAFHGYPGAVHMLVHGRPNAGRFHVRGYSEEGTTTTPFDMVVLNATSRYHLAMEALKRARRPPADAASLMAACHVALARHREYVAAHFEDLPEIPGLDLVRAVTAARVLCLNAGSSSLKFGLYALAAGRADALAQGAVEAIGLPDGRLRLEGPGVATPVARAGVYPDHAAAVHAAFEALDAAGLPAPAAVGHRLVHGGPDYLAPTRLDAAVLAGLRRAVPFAPLHLPAEIAGIEAVAARAPGVPQVGCFDTAFHATMPDVAQRFPLPRAAVADGVRRYGFHGLSYEYVVAHVGAGALGRAVVAHLGNGASLAAIRDGVSVETTMGFTPTAGVMMGTRSGDLDPGLLVYLLAHRGYDARSLERLVTHEAGLRGVSGATSDMRVLLARRGEDADAALAVAMFCYQVRKAVGALAAVLGGLDALVFTGGIGEHAPAVRAEVCAGLGHLGVALDGPRNDASAAVVSPADGSVVVRVVRTNEEQRIARHVGGVLGWATG